MFAKLRLIALFAFVALATSAATAQQHMDNSAVIKLKTAGLGDDLIVQTINASQGRFDISTDAMIDLKKQGVSDAIIGAMVTKNATSSESSVAASSIVSSAVDAADPSNLRLASKVIPKNATVFVAPMDGFEIYLISALDKKQVPVVVVTDRSKADFEITGNADSQKAGWAKTIMTGSSRSTEEASINVHNIKSGAIVFAYNVNKSSSARGRQSTAEACAKHLKEKIDSTK